jgi:hypothetical protein
MKMKEGRSLGAMVVAAIAIIFGLLTIKSGGSVLFWDEQARQAAGDYVPFVLWFNFVAGFFYVITGLSMLWQRRWALPMAATLLIATLLVYALLALHIASGQPYEMRTVIAMLLRSAVLGVVTVGAYFQFKRLRTQNL